MKIGWKSFLEYLGQFPQAATENSTKLLSLLISAITGGILAGIIIPIILIYDVITNGHIETDLGDLGVFVLCIGAYIFGAGYGVKVPKIQKPEKREEEIRET